jgi:polysaccharide biosynthesis transport protein
MSEDMTTEPMSTPARYMTLRDYLLVIRRHWLMIVLLAVVGAGAGLATVIRQKPVYTAGSEVSFQDPNQQLSVVGLGSSAPQSAAQLAELGAQSVTGQAVLNQVHQKLKHGPSAAALSGSISATVDQQSGLLDISATGSSPQAASTLANAAASVLVAQNNQHARAAFAKVANDIRGRIAALPPAQRSASPASPLTYYENELARLQTLGSVATGAQVEKLAQAGAAASSEHRTRSVLIGLLLGLLLGIVVAFIRDSMDRRLRDPQEIDSSFQLPLLGYVGKRSMGRVAGVTNGSRAKHGSDLEQFRILRRNLEMLDHHNPPRSILVTSTAPGDGKTTVASSLAFAMAAAGKRTLLVDCDLRRSTLAARLGVESSPGISEYLAGAVTPEQILRTVELPESLTLAGADTQQPRHGNGSVWTPQKLVCIPSGAATSRAAELLGSQRFSDFIAQVSDAYDAVVLDSSPLLAVADTLEMLPHVDAVVICARESRTTRGQAQAARATLGRFPARPAGVVVTGVRPGAAGDDRYAYAYGYS